MDNKQVHAEPSLSRFVCREAADPASRYHKLLPVACDMMSDSCLSVLSWVFLLLPWGFGAESTDTGDCTGTTLEHWGVSRVVDNDRVGKENGPRSNAIWEDDADHWQLELWDCDVGGSGRGPSMCRE